MGVEQNDFVGFRTVDLAGMAQPDQVLGVVAAVVLPHAGLTDHERLESFLAQFGEHGGGRNVAVPLGAAGVLVLRKDRRDHGANLVIRQGMIGTQHRGSRCETGCELHDAFS
jgi:hypothetical protein